MYLLYYIIVFIPIPSFVSLILSLISFLFTGSVSKIVGKSDDCKDGVDPGLVAGVVGAPSSVTSIQVANLLKLFKLPQVSGLLFNRSIRP